MEPLAVQLIHFMLAVAIGVVIGILFDIYRVFRYLLSLPWTIIPILDFLWWVMVTCLVFSILLWENWGEVRFYIFIGQAVGFALYVKNFSMKFRKYFKISVLWLYKTIKTLIKWVLIPIKIIKKIIFWPFAIISLVLYKIMRFIKKTKSFIILLGKGIPRKLWHKCRKIFTRK